jgi:intergrase/recombinase
MLKVLRVLYLVKTKKLGDIYVISEDRTLAVTKVKELYKLTDEDILTTQTLAVESGALLFACAAGEITTAVIYLQEES